MKGVKTRVELSDLKFIDLNSVNTIPRTRKTSKSKVKIMPSERPAQSTANSTTISRWEFAVDLGGQFKPHFGKPDCVAQLSPGFLIKTNAAISSK
jgi:hypothetical protein